MSVTKLIALLLLVVIGSSLAYIFYQNVWLALFRSRQKP